MPPVSESGPQPDRLPEEFDPFSQETIESPYGFYASLRAHAPVYRVPRADYYLVSRHADIKSVVMNPGTFSSNLTSIVMAQTDGSMASLDVSQLGIGPMDVLAVEHSEYKGNADQLVMEVIGIEYKGPVCAASNAT